MVLNRRNVFLAVGSAVLFLIVSTTFLIAYTRCASTFPGIRAPHFGAKPCGSTR